MRYKPSEKIKKLIWNDWKNPRMYDYCVGKLSNELELENGLILKFEKPSIETHFCYGYSLSNIDTESYDIANKNVENARKDIINFINENIAQSGLQALYNKLKKADTVYYSNCNNNGIVSVSSLFDQNDECRFRYDYGENSEHYKRYITGELSKSDVQKIIAKVAEELQKFVKRLNTYLKRYGLSKVHSWSYWRDE